MPIETETAGVDQIDLNKNDEGEGLDHDFSLLFEAYAYRRNTPQDTERLSLALIHSDLLLYVNMSDQLTTSVYCVSAADGRMEEVHSIAQYFDSPDAISCEMNEQSAQVS